VLNNITVVGQPSVLYFLLIQPFSRDQPGSSCLSRAITASSGIVGSFSGMGSSAFD
jgi:hypothetical protein